MLSPPGKHLFSGFKTVFTTTATKGFGKLDKALRDSRGSDLLTCPRKYRGGMVQYFFLTLEEFIKGRAQAGLAIKACALFSLVHIICVVIPTG